MTRKHRPSRVAVAGGSVAVLLLASGCSNGSDPGTDVPATAPTATAEPDGDAAAGQESSPSGEPTEVEPTTIEQVDAGETRLTLDQGFLDTLQTLRVEVRPVPPATQEGSTFVFPVTGGRATLDPTAADPFTGTLAHQGGLEMSALGNALTFTDLAIDADAGQVTAMLNGRRVPLLALDGSQVDLARRAGRTVVSDEAASLRPEAVDQLTQRLDLPPLPSVDLGQLEVALPTE